MTIIDNAVYVDGIRSAEPRNLEQTFETLTERTIPPWFTDDFVRRHVYPTRFAYELCDGLAQFHHAGRRSVMCEAFP